MKGTRRCVSKSIAGEQRQKVGRMVGSCRGSEVGSSSGEQRQETKQVVGFGGRSESCKVQKNCR